MDLRVDTPPMRKTRGAFFTPPELAQFITDWAIREPDDSVLEPSCGDAVFLRSAGRSLAAVGRERPHRDQLVGFDIHEDSIADARSMLHDSGFDALLTKQDFFDTNPTGTVSAVVGNPPYIRFQGFAGDSRKRALARASRAGVELSGLASSWAAFVVHGAACLEVGGRMGFVLPAELLSVNYAAPVRRFLLENFASIELVVFDELVFADVQADVVVLLADGYNTGSADHFHLHLAKNASSIDIGRGSKWAPANASDKWTDALAPNDAARILALVSGEVLQPLGKWGQVISGAVTGANQFFSLTSTEAEQLGLTEDELLPLLPAGFKLANQASVSKQRWLETVVDRKAYLFYPEEPPSEAAKVYIATGEALGYDLRYKCRVRSPWWRVPLVRRADLFVSYMSGSTPRIVGNSARLLNLNSVHGLEVDVSLRALAMNGLPVAAMNSASLLSAELVGRSYGGGVLKMEPTEAARWLVPSPTALRDPALRPLLKRGRALLTRGDSEGCTAIADQILLMVGAEHGLTAPMLDTLRDTRAAMVRKRVTRGASKL